MDPPEATARLAAHALSLACTLVDAGPVTPVPLALAGTTTYFAHNACNALCPGCCWRSPPAGTRETSARAHADVTALAKSGLPERTENGGLDLPHDANKVDLVVKAA